MFISLSHNFLLVTWFERSIWYRLFVNLGHRTKFRNWSPKLMITLLISILIHFKTVRNFHFDPVWEIETWPKMQVDTWYWSPSNTFFGQNFDPGVLGTNSKWPYTLLIRDSKAVQLKAVEPNISRIYWMDVKIIND